MKMGVTWQADFIITTSTMQPYLSYPYYIQVLLKVCFSQLPSFVEEGTGIGRNEDQLDNYWSPTGMEGETWITMGLCQSKGRWVFTTLKSCLQAGWR